MADQPESIFESQNNPQETPASNQNNGAANPNPASNASPFEDLLKEIVNEQGQPKYKTVQDALNGLKHAQEYIPQVKKEKTEAEKELAVLREEVQRLASLEETVRELTQRQGNPSTSEQTLSEEDIASLVEKTLTRKQQAERQTNNIKAVVSALQEKFGAESEGLFYAKAQEMGLSNEEMNTLAARSPKAVLAMLGVSEPVAHKQTSVAPSQGTVNTAALQSKPNTYIGPETTRVTIGATTADLKKAVDNASMMAEELAAQGLTTYDLTDPKLYNKYFNNK